MTDTTTTTNACPQCGTPNPVVMSGGIRFCPNCRHEWNPAQLAQQLVPPPPPDAPLPSVVGVHDACGHDWVYHLAGAGCTVMTADGACECTEPPPPPEHTDETPTDKLPSEVQAESDAWLQSLDDVLQPPEVALAARDAQAQLDALVGTQVVLEGGQLATIVSFPDDDHAEVIIGEFTDEARAEVVALGDVERSVAAPPPVADVSDETAQALARTNMAVAGLALRAGVATLAGDAADYELITPPTGWLPDDADTMPVVEQGVAYAIAFLIKGFGMDAEVVDAIATTLLNDSQVEPTKGENQ